VHVVVGDESLDSALNEEESLCMDKVYDALDWYKKAVMEAREIEVHCNSVQLTLVAGSWPMTTYSNITHTHTHTCLTALFPGLPG